MLTKEYIEAIHDSADIGLDFMVTHEELVELCRLALLGLERDERAERIGRAVLHWVADETPQSLQKDSARMAKRGLPAYALLLASIADAMEEP